MIVEAELSSISRRTLLEVDGRLKIVEETKDQDRYQLPILTGFKKAQPFLFDYLTARVVAATMYRSNIASSGYSIGSALGYDIITSHIASLGRTIDVTPFHVGMHDPIFLLAGVLGVAKVSTAGKYLDRDWFDLTWANYYFNDNGKIRFRKPTVEGNEFTQQVNKAPVLLDYLRHLDFFFSLNPEIVKQGLMTGIFDQLMIYRHRLQDLDGPDQRYIIEADGSKKLPPSPPDLYYFKKLALKIFGRRF